MISYQYRALRTDKGLLNLHGCAQGVAGCRALDVPQGITADSADAVEASRQTVSPLTRPFAHTTRIAPRALRAFGAPVSRREPQSARGAASRHRHARSPLVQALRSTLYARSLPLPSGEGYVPLHQGLVSTVLRRTCIGAGDDGTYYLTLSSDAVDSGDGRLSSSADGYLPTEIDGSPISGVEATGWAGVVTALGCWCCTDGHCGVCDASSAAGCSGLTMPPPSRRKVLGYRMHTSHLQFSAGLVTSTSTQQGCVSFGQWRYYEVRTSTAEDAQILVDISASVEGLYAAVDRLPSSSDYDQVLPPASPCPRIAY